MWFASCESRATPLGAGESSPGTESVNTTISFHRYFMLHYSSSLSWSWVYKIMLRGTASFDSRLNVVGLRRAHYCQASLISRTETRFLFSQKMGSFSLGHTRFPCHTVVLRYLLYPKIPRPTSDRLGLASCRLRPSKR